LEKRGEEKGEGGKGGVGGRSRERTTPHPKGGKKGKRNFSNLHEEGGKRKRSRGKKRSQKSRKENTTGFSMWVCTPMKGEKKRNLKGQPGLREEEDGEKGRGRGIV